MEIRSLSVSSSSCKNRVHISILPSRTRAFALQRFPAFNNTPLGQEVYYRHQIVVEYFFGIRIAAEHKNIQHPVVIPDCSGSFPPRVRFHSEILADIRVTCIKCPFLRFNQSGHFSIRAASERGRGGMQPRGERLPLTLRYNILLP